MPLLSIALLGDPWVCSLESRSFKLIIERALVNLINAYPFSMPYAGGMQALEWCALTEESPSDGPALRSAAVIGCGAAHGAWQIAISETQRQAIYSDPKWRGGDVDSR